MAGQSWDGLWTDIPSNNCTCHDLIFRYNAHTQKSVNENGGSNRVSHRDCNVAQVNDHGFSIQR